jgi:hypothetical protein
MAVDPTALVIPGRATVFHAPVNAALPADPLTVFDINAENIATGWTNLGHTSKDNTVNFAREGGEATTINTYLADAVRTVYSSVAWTLNIPALQFDQDVLDMAFNGDFDTDGGYIIPGAASATSRALFLLFEDGTGKLGFYIPNTTVTLGDVPSFSPEAFTELPLVASIQAANADTIPAAGGKSAIMKLYKTSLAEVVAA